MEKLEVSHKRLFDAAYYAAEAIKKAIDLNVLPKNLAEEMSQALDDLDVAMESSKKHFVAPGC
ncbi:MAG: hypothetical protein KBC08_02760 [Caldisericia bacterium]|nr:hypothetical protein [Caldisericia bacterium]